MKKFVWAILFSLLLPLSAWAKDFSVRSFSPGGEVSGKPEIKVVFSGPVVEKGMLGKVLPQEQVPLNIRPSIKGHGIWDGPDTLLFVPDKALAQATEYQVSMKPLRDLSGSLLAGPQSFRFNTPPLKLMSTRQVEMTPYGELTMEFVFSLPVPPQRLLGFVSASSGGRTLRLSPQGEAPSKKIVVKVDDVQGEPLSLTFEKGLASDVGPLGLVKTEKVVLEPSVRLAVTGSFGESCGDGQGRMIVYTSRPVDPGDVKGYVSLSPERKFRLEPIYGGFALVGEFLPRDRFTVTLKKGLGGEDGLEADRKLSFVMPDMERSVSFPASGTFLSPVEEPRIPLDTVNLDRVQVSAWKLYPNNVPVVTGALESGVEPPKSLSRALDSRFFNVDNRLNKTVRGALDLKEFLGESRGVFLIEADDGEGGWNVARQMITLTDLGISARVWEKGMLVWVNGLSSATPVSGAAVSVYSSSNQVIAQGVTDGDGLWTMERENRWDPQLRPAVVTVEHGEDLSFLVLAGDRFSDSGIDVAGAPWVSSYEADCLLPRGIFRPGEVVEITSVVRGPKMTLPGEFPVIWKITNAMDVESARGSGVLSPWGTSTASFQLPPEAPTGKYRFELSVPGGEDLLGAATFLVEDFTPPRIELKLESATPTTSIGSDLAMSFSAAYLFGAPSPGLSWEMQAVTLPRRFVSERFPGFAFGDGETPFNSTEEYVGSGSLDELGKGEFSWTVPTEWKAPSMVDLALSLQAMEPGGRWVSQTLTLPCAVSIHQLGIRSPEGDIVPGAPAPFKVAAVTAEDLPVSIPIRWELFSMADRYVMVREDGRTRMKWQEERVPVSDGTFSTDDGIADLSVTPDVEGRYLLVLSDGRGSSASVRFDAWRPWGTSARAASVPDRVELTLDKPTYSGGDKASVAYRSPFPGAALLTVESDGLVRGKVIRSLEEAGKLSFQVDEGIWPNGWCTLQIVRPVSPGGTWGPHRALGAVSLPIATDDTRASVELTAPAQIEPGRSLDVSVSVKDGAGKPLSGQLWIALVDRGILGLTGHGTPDPWGVFTSLRKLGSRALDLYDELIPIESRETPLLHPAGGAGGAMLALNLSPLRARGFKVLSVVKAPVDVRDGSAVVSFDIPEFSGGARLMAVFCGDLMGSAQSDISVAREIVVDPTVPQVLAPGDRVMVPVQIISTASTDLSLDLAVESEGAWAYRGESALAVAVPAGESRSLELEMEVLPHSGHGDLSVRVSSGGGLDFSVHREVVVRPPMPRITVSGGAVVEKGSYSAEERGRWLPGSMKSTLYMSGSRRADLLPLVSFLRGYPYSCLEQTVSASWPLLVLPEMVGEMESLSQSEVRDLLGGQISRLQTLQLYDGGFTSWPNGAVDPWGSLYAAHLLASVDPALVPQGMADRSGAFLRALLSDPEEDSQALSRKAYGAYVMALSGQPPMGWMAWLSERVGEMDDSGRAFLAGAYGLAGKKDQGLSLMGGGGKRGVDPYGSAIGDEAVRLLAMEALAPGGSEEALMANGLIKAVGSGDLSTHDAGLAVLALGRYSARADMTPFSAELTYGDKVVSLSTGDDLALSSDAFVPWTLKNAGPGPVYCSWTLSGVPLDPAVPTDQGFKVRRTFTDREGKTLDLSKPLVLGQEVSVRIEITPTGTVRDLVVVDVLPGCLEVWNPALEVGVESVSARREVRFDRVIFFPDGVESPVTVGYRCRVVSKGDFALPPVAAEAMYDSGIRSLSGGGRITVR